MMASRSPLEIVKRSWKFARSGSDRYVTACSPRIKRSTRWPQSAPLVVGSSVYRAAHASDQDGSAMGVALTDEKSVSGSHQ